MEATTKLVSVIIPVYNCEKYIKKSVQAVLNGQYHNVEIILVNDGSTDRSLEFCNQLQAQDDRVKVYSQKNGGPSAARNKGVELAIGEYIIFMDSDDEASKYYVSDLTDLMRNKDAVLGQVSYTQDIGKLSQNSIERTSLKNCTSNEAFRLLWCDGIVDGYLWNKIFLRKRITENKNRFCEETRIWEDSLFIFEYLSVLRGKCFTSENKDYFYRVNDESITHNTETENMLDSKCVVIQRIALLNENIQGRELDSELNKVKLTLLSTRMKKLKPIKRDAFNRYENLVKTSRNLTIFEQIKASVMLFILGLFVR